MQLRVYRQPAATAGNAKGPTRRGCPADQGRKGPRRPVRCIARRRSVLIAERFGRYGNAAKCRAGRRGPGRDPPGTPGAGVVPGYDPGVTAALATGDRAGSGGRADGRIGRLVITPSGRVRGNGTGGASSGLGGASSGLGGRRGRPGPGRAAGPGARPAREPGWIWRGWSCSCAASPTCSVTRPCSSRVVDLRLSTGSPGRRHLPGGSCGWCQQMTWTASVLLSAEAGRVKPWPGLAWTRCSQALPFQFARFTR